MAAYTVESDKFFLGSYGVEEGVQVYELDGLCTFPVKSKHWRHLDFDIRLGNKYEALKIGDKEIWGDHLLTLTNDLFNSGLMVNREGLCFLPTRPAVAMDMGVEYFRMFDLYNWSKYEVITSLNTRWARGDILSDQALDVVESHPGDGDNEYEVELKAKEKDVDEENEGLKHEAELKDGIEKVKSEHREELEKAKDAEQQDLDIVEETAQLEYLEGDINEGITEADNLEEQLKLYVFDRSDLSSTWDFYSKIAEKMWTDIPLVNISINLDFQRSNWPPTAAPDMVIPLSSVESAESLPHITLMCSSSDDYIYFDSANWRVIKVAVPTLSNIELEYKPLRYIMAYYEGSSNFTYLASAYEGRVSFPSPCLPEHIKYFGPLSLKHIVGIGTRLVYFYTAFSLLGDGL